MAATVKITKDMIIRASYEIILNEGYECLNARSIAHRMKISTQPIYSYFNSMEEVVNDVLFYASNNFLFMLYESLDENDVFFSLAKEYINIASNRPHLFKFLFVSFYKPKISPTSIFEGVLRKVKVDKIFGKFSSLYNMDEKTTREVFLKIWSYVHGIASYSLVNEKEPLKNFEKSMRDTINDIIKGEMMRKNFE